MVSVRLIRRGLDDIVSHGRHSVEGDSVAASFHGFLRGCEVGRRRTIRLDVTPPQHTLPGHTRAFDAT